MESRCTASVFTTTVRAPWIPIRCSRLTELPPAPPQPTTKTFGRAIVNESRNDWFPARWAVPIPIPGPIPWRFAVADPLRPPGFGIARGWPSALSLSPFHGLVEPTADVLANRVADRILDGHGVARLHELLKV